MHSSAWKVRLQVPYPAPMAAVHPSSSGLQTDPLYRNATVANQTVQHERPAGAR